MPALSQERAAIIIQGAWRGFCARRLLEDMRTSERRNILRQFYLLSEAEKRLDTIGQKAVNTKNEAIVQKFHVLKSKHESQKAVLQARIEMFQQAKVCRDKRMGLKPFTFSSNPASPTTTPHHVTAVQSENVSEYDDEDGEDLDSIGFCLSSANLVFSPIAPLPTIHINELDNEREDQHTHNSLSEFRSQTSEQLSESFSGGRSDDFQKSTTGGSSRWQAIKNRVKGWIGV